jgi:hypothetical protein
MAQLPFTGLAGKWCYCGNNQKGKSGIPSVYFDNYFGWQKPLAHGYEILILGMANATWMAYRNTDQPLFTPVYNDPLLVYHFADYVLAGTTPGLFEGDPLVNPSMYNMTRHRSDLSNR